ncbi:major capsid protein [Algicola sagamiensis]|uniref:major capsid protein n=1 Tax=Algicola sagamiensis TaxID=163869 RepID=UPI000378DB80|nr:major capsid protein [Algicola sagamiensis]
MAELVDVLNSDAFAVTTMTEAINEVETVPDRLERLNLFRPNPIRTESIMIDAHSEKLSLINTSIRGEAPEVRQRTYGNTRNLSSVRLAVAAKVMASELAFIRALGTTAAIESVQKEFARRFNQLMDDMRTTHEHMRLGALQGKLINAKGQLVYDYYKEFGIDPNPEIFFDLTNLMDGNLKELIAQEVLRPMQRAAKGCRFNEIRALCGDGFWDSLIKNPEVRETYKVQLDGQTLREPGIGFELRFGGVIWENYVGTDDNKTVAVQPNEVCFFPAGAQSDVFEMVLSPGESFGDIGEEGQKFYAMQLMDEKRHHFVDLELYSYPLFYARRPKMLFKGQLGSSESTVAMDTESHTSQPNVDELLVRMNEMQATIAALEAKAVPEDESTLLTDDNIPLVDEDDIAAEGELERTAPIESEAQTPSAAGHHTRKTNRRKN